MDLRGTIDPLAICAKFWPSVSFYKEQVDAIYSVDRNYETVIVAGNMLGKDFTAAFIVLSLFLRALKHGKTCRIVTTSVADHHLKVLWGEIGRFVMTSAFPLCGSKEHKTAPIFINHHEIRYNHERWAKNPLSYVRGLVSERGEGLAGHHADWTLAVVDEASGVHPDVKKYLDGWAKRQLIFGNPNQCENFFKHAVKGFPATGDPGGDLLAPLLARGTR